MVNRSFFYSACHLQFWIRLAAWSRPYVQTGSRHCGEELGLEEDPAQQQGRAVRGGDVN